VRAHGHTDIWFAYVALIAILNGKKNIYHMVIVQRDCYTIISLFKQEKRERVATCIPRPTRGRAKPLLGPY
jgi:hypothetical protein